MRTLIKDSPIIGKKRCAAVRYLKVGIRFEGTVFMIAHSDTGAERY